MRALTIRTRLMLNLLTISILACAILSFVGSRYGQNSIQKEVENQLNLVRTAKKVQLEQYFSKIGSLVEVLGQNEMIIQAAKDFKQGYRTIGADNALNSQCSAELESHYQLFMDRLLENLEVKPDLDNFIPQTTEACFLQYQYIVNNKNPIGEKDALVDAQNNTFYNRTHVEYHAYFRSLVEKFKFYDIFIIDLDLGDVVYSVYKETDFATSVFSGPYRESNLAKLTRKIKNNVDLESAQWVDFEAYRPSYGAPAAFVGVPISDGGQSIAALVFQLPVDEINAVMTGNQNWEEDGLGASGETYIVGEDYLMKSISRFFLQDTLGYRQALKQLGKTEEDLDKMYRFGTTIMQQEVKSDAVKDALAGNTNTQVVKDYRNVDVISSYSPLALSGFNWVILAEKDAVEAFQVVSDYNKQMFLVTVLLILIITLIALWLASRFVKPIEKLTEGTRKIANGVTDHRVDIHTRDEFGELAQSFNLMVGNLDDQQKLIQEQNSSNEALLLNFIPSEIANRVKAGEDNIADTYTNVSVIAIDLVGFSQLTEKIGAQRSVQLLNEIIEAFDDSAEKNFIEKIRTVGDTYFAACGLFNSRLDHAKRVLQFAREINQLIGQFNLNHQEQLKVHISINSGDVAAGIIGKHHFNFDIWGVVVNELFRMNELEIDDVILISEGTKNRLSADLEYQTVTDPIRPELKIYALPLSTKKPVTA